MKDLSFFLLKNLVGAKMKRGIRNFCNGDGSTSTLNQHQTDHNGAVPAAVANANANANAITSSDHFVTNPPSVVASNTTQSPPTTLEEMILRLELEEELARKAKLNEYSEIHRGGRMSCVNNSDILRSARNALNQYPRFSLDGKDAMYRSSFRNSEIISGRNSVCCDHGLRERYCKIEFESRLGKNLCLPSTFGGESVIWCKPGVVAKLMGLDSMPVPVRSRKGSKQKLSSLIKRQNLRKRAERHEMERRLAMDMTMSNNNDKNFDDDLRRASMGGSCSKTGYFVMNNPVVVDQQAAINGEGGWPTRRFL